MFVRQQPTATDTFASATLVTQEPTVRTSTPATAIHVSTVQHARAIATLTYAFVQQAIQDPIVIPSMLAITAHVSTEPHALTLATAIAAPVPNSTVGSTVRHTGIHALVLHA